MSCGALVVDATMTEAPSRVYALLRRGLNLPARGGRD